MICLAHSPLPPAHSFALVVYVLIDWQIDSVVTLLTPYHATPRLVGSSDPTPPPAHSSSHMSWLLNEVIDKLGDSVLPEVLHVCGAPVARHRFGCGRDGGWISL